MRLTTLVRRTALTFSSLLLAAATFAADPEAGKAKTATCLACHGEGGISAVPEYPNLACQNEKYLVIAIKSYKDGTRSNAIMMPMVAALSDEDVANVAAYYASLPCKP